MPVLKIFIRKIYSMKSKFFKFIAVAVIGISVAGCGLFRKAGNGGNNGNETAMYGQTMTYNARQVDSMCVADGISSNLEDWMSMYYVDYETNEQINRYTFIKSMSESEEMVYILTPRDTLYKVTKRYVKEAEEDE